MVLLLVASAPSNARPQFSETFQAGELASIGTNVVSDISASTLGGYRELNNGLISFSMDVLNQGADIATDSVRAVSDTAVDSLGATRALYDASTGYFIDQFGRIGRFTTAGLGVMADLFVAGATAGGAFATALAQAGLNGFQNVGTELGNLVVE